MIRSFGKNIPNVHPTAYIHPAAEVIGRVILGENSSLWPMVVLRGDIEPIRIGDASNVQDSAVMHTSKGLPVVLGKGVTVGHGAIVHGSRIGDYTLIGMGAILLDGSTVGAECLIGAGAVIPEGARIPPRSLVLGVPGKVARALRRDEIAGLHHRARDYVAYAAQHRQTSFPIADPR
ncbi:MAG TPA: gamma carbonic anhydrase family protein [Elusimicrobiota bacterium]|nr:gamma carbonic anhydrase family protein [Elusimicrobiota bacterium]